MATPEYERAKALARIFSSEQMYTFAEVQRRSEDLLGRPVLTHEFARPWYLVAEILGAPRRDPMELLRELKA